MTPTPSDGDMLLRAILDAPDDDTARLVYADWLEENGQGPRAVFIRMQLSAPQTPGLYWPLTSRRGLPATGFAELLGARPWTVPHVMGLLAGGEYVQSTNSTTAVLWRRGFIEAVHCSPAQLAASLGFLKAHPVREVRLNDIPLSKLVKLIDPSFLDWRGFVGGVDCAKAELKLILSKPFPHLLTAAFDLRRPGDKYSPFELVAPPPS